MGLRFDGTVTLGNVLTLATILLMGFGAWYKFLRKIDLLIQRMEDFPPHRHTNGGVIYPKGFDPGASVKR